MAAFVAWTSGAVLFLIACPCNFLFGSKITFKTVIFIIMKLSEEIGNNTEILLLNFVRDQAKIKVARPKTSTDW